MPPTGADARQAARARGRQAAARARQLIGDSDPEGSDDDSDFEPLIHHRGAAVAKLTLADIALKHTRGYARSFAFSTISFLFLFSHYNFESESWC